jgi:hypothetical protein
MVKAIIFCAIVALLLMPAVVRADVIVSLQQTDRDSGSVIAGKSFTVTASGWSGSCSSALIDLSECSVCSIDESTSKSISGPSVSWTTLMATQTDATQKITVSVSGTCSPDSGDVEFIAKSAPVISDSVSPTSLTVTQGGSFTLSLNVLNSGETTAQGSISVSPSDFSISNCPFTPIPGGQSMGMNCEIGVSSSATTGARIATLSITTTQGNEITKTISVTVQSSGDGGNGNGDGPGGTVGGECEENWTCSDWGPCINGTQTRTCTDLNECNTTEDKPPESQSCIEEPEDNETAPPDGPLGPEGPGEGGPGDTGPGGFIPGIDLTTLAIIVIVIIVVIVIALAALKIVKL